MKRRIKYLLILLSALLCCLAVWLCHRKPAGRLQEIPAATETERLRWLSAQGLEGQQISEQVITIPQDLAGNYADYAALQEHQLLPLKAYAGKHAACITYMINGSEPQMYAELLVADGILIGAQCYTPENSRTLTMQGMPFTASSENRT